MLDKAQSRPDFLLLLSLLLVILMYPVLDHGDLRRLMLGVLMFVPILLAVVRLVEMRRRVWPAVLLMSATFFGLTVAGLFSYLRHAQSVSDVHLTTAISIYLLLGLQWFALYSAIDVFYPGSILHNGATITDRSSELLYFSLVTLSTIGYGDVVPIYGEVRMLAALEGVTGVLYIAITVAFLVSAYRQRNGPSHRESNGDSS